MVGDALGVEKERKGGTRRGRVEQGANSEWTKRQKKSDSSVSGGTVKRWRETNEGER